MFLTTLSADEYPPDKWILDEPLIYERITSRQEVPVEVVDLSNRVDWLTVIYSPLGQPKGYRITIPAGFVSDLASLPRLCRPLIDVNGKHRKAAVLHDALYRHAPALSRSFCDSEFGHAMKCCGVGWWTRKLMLAGVRMGGWCAYNKHKARNTE